MNKGYELIEYTVSLVGKIRDYFQGTLCFGQLLKLELGAKVES